ncbi:MAG: RNA-binding S4 domain-containing protein [Nitrospirota bacterium]|nr:RNA-binding S4 domain-containing protein [Nitrospirota bacterium]
MRLDLYLKQSRLIKRRSIANDACDRGLVLCNGTPAKAGKEIKEGDTLTIMFRHRVLTIRVDTLPARKNGDASCFTVITDEPGEVA